MKVEISARYYNDDKTQRLVELRITTVIESIFDQLKSALAIDRLKTIFIPENYHEELHLFQEKLGMNSFSTKNSHCEAIGQMLPFFNNGEKEYYIFYSKHYALAIVSGSLKCDLDMILREKYEDAMHFFIHELAHIHEEEVIDEIGYTDLKSKEVKSSFYWRLSRYLWSEYYASRLSAELFNITDRNINPLLESWGEIELKVIHSRWNCNLQTISIAEFERKTYESLRYILISFAYFIAIYSSANRSNVLEFTKQISDFPLLKLLKIIEPMGSELNHLYVEFNKGNRIEFTNIELQIEMYYKEFGINYEKIGEEIHISVPYDKSLYDEYSIE